MSEYFLAGGVMMWPLLLCSIVGAAVILERCIFWRRLDLAAQERECAKIIGLVSQGGGLPPEKPEKFLPRLLYTGLSLPREAADKSMEIMAIEALGAMRKRMGLLDVIITAAPMLGIMGTVLGIIISFNALGESGVADPKAVMQGIGQALATTLAGLGVALFCLFPFNWLNARIENCQDRMEVWITRAQLIKAEK